MSLTAGTAATLPELMDRMGHSSTRAPMIYMHASDARQHGYMTSSDRARVPEPTIELQLALADDPGYPHDLMRVLERWHQYLVSWVLPRMFAVADGNPPPILITG